MPHGIKNPCPEKAHSDWDQLRIGGLQQPITIEDLTPSHFPPVFLSSITRPALTSTPAFCTFWKSWGGQTYTFSQMKKSVCDFPEMWGSRKHRLGSDLLCVSLEALGSGNGFAPRISLRDSTGNSGEERESSRFSPAKNRPFPLGVRF